MNYRYFVVELNKRLYQVDIYTNGYSVEKKQRKLTWIFVTKSSYIMNKQKQTTKHYTTKNLFQLELFEHFRKHILLVTLTNYNHYLPFFKE